MSTSTSILRQNTLDLGMMKVLALALSALFLVGCDSYQVELDPAWEGEQTDTTEPSPTDPTEPSTEEPTEPSTEEPTDDEAPWIELSDPDETEPSEADNCAFVDCSVFGPFCYDDYAVECCDPCLVGTQSCHPDSPYSYYNELFFCAGGCWETSTNCGEEGYCKFEEDGGSLCAPLPTQPDDFCEPGLEWVDPDCQTCTPCDTPGESYCDHSGFSDTVIECKDVTGYDYYCWEAQTCQNTGFESFCVADLANNFAACTDQGPSEEFCDQFACTGTTLCDGEPGSSTAPITDCGYCNKCCDVTEEALCGYDAPYQGGSAAMLFPSADGLCYEISSCNDMTTGNQYYCKMSYESGPICEMAGF